LVNGEKGRYFVVRGRVDLFGSWETVPYVASNIFVNLTDYYESMERIDNMRDSVLPGHGGRVFDKPFYP